MFSIIKASDITAWFLGRSIGPCYDEGDALVALLPVGTPLAWLTRIGNLPDGRLKLDLRRQPPALPGSDTRILESAIEELGSLPLPFFGSPAQIRTYYPEWIEPDGADPVPITAEALFAAHGKPFDRNRFPRG